MSKFIITSINNFPFVLLPYLPIKVLTWLYFQVGDFKTYGIEWLKQFPNDVNYTTSVKHKLFPKMVACEIKR